VTSLVIIGSTGSIGKSALNVIETHLPNVRIVGLAAGRNVELLAKQIRKYHPKIVAVSDIQSAEKLKGLLGVSCPEVLVGEAGLRKLSGLAEADTVLLSVSGAMGVWPAWEAVRAGKRLALATKEALVLLGELLISEAKRAGAEIIPVDSEHSALFQLLRGTPPQDVKALWLGASGGPFRAATAEDLKNVTPKQALAHPVWKMGPKVTIDSATLMNKGLEIIEAHWFFNIPTETIRVFIHPQGLVHAMVELVDGTLLMHAGLPDMKLPIAYALSYPDRVPGVLSPLDLTEIGNLIFERPDPERFPCLDLARRAIEMGGTATAALNAADEVAVTAFLEERISFTAIPQLIEKVLNAHHPQPVNSPQDALDADRQSRELAGKILNP